MSGWSEMIEALQRHSILWVMAAFAVIVLWTYWPSRKRRVEAQGRIPLHDDP
jgi:cbb3-type cytochrome oxidase subunit 3